MIDALGNPQSLLVLGGSSDIATATARRLVQARTRRVVLAGRPSTRLDAAAQLLRGAGADLVEVVPFDAEVTDTHGAVVDQAFAGGDIDVVLLAFGVLGEQAAQERDPSLAVRTAMVNYVGAVSVGLHVGARLRSQGHGVLVVLSSVAGERARRTNFVYGSTKAGLDAFSQGLGDALQGSGARVLVVRPGFVRTKMTAGRQEAPMTTTPEAVAVAITDGIRSGRHTVWVPARLQQVMAVLRHLPRGLFRRLAR
ncbi:MAG: decaprenylphospho-beta-D-erythro-pentofuranosid-2-ulose 2-reductase [Actinomycetota bacterium]|nr:decaprenylphospho-beta-D-erythro-pentofuranosid-2-ulose 2-reductase [Actinomycetota bacterium]